MNNANKTPALAPQWTKTRADKVRIANAEAFLRRIVKEIGLNTVKITREDVDRWRDQAGFSTRAASTTRLRELGYLERPKPGRYRIASALYNAAKGGDLEPFADALVFACRESRKPENERTPAGLGATVEPTPPEGPKPTEEFLRDLEEQGKACIWVELQESPEYLISCALSEASRFVVRQYPNLSDRALAQLTQRIAAESARHAAEGVYRAEVASGV